MKTFQEFIIEAKKCWPGYKKKGTKKLFGKTYNNCVKAEGYVPLRTSDEHYDDEGFPTTTRSWSKKMTNARLSVGKQKMRSRYGIGDQIGNLTKGVSAKTRLDAMKKVDDEPESKRAKRSQAASERNRQLGSNKRKLQTSLDREHLTRSLNNI
jgi:hypothetical protein